MLPNILYQLYRYPLALVSVNFFQHTWDGTTNLPVVRILTVLLEPAILRLNRNLLVYAAQQKSPYIVRA